MPWSAFTFCASAVALLVAGGNITLAHESMASADEGKRPNPIAAERKSIEQGGRIYLDSCAACHGDKIEGMRAAETGLKMDSPELKRRLLTHTDGDFFWKIKNGRGDLPDNVLGRAASYWVASVVPPCVHCRL